MSTTQSTAPIAAGEDEHLALDRIAQVLDEHQPQQPLQFLDADRQVITLPGRWRMSCVKRPTSWRKMTRSPLFRWSAI
jgi:hypothetical protein